MRVFAASVNFQLAIEGAAEAVVRDHSTNSALDDEFRTALAACTESLGFVTADIAGEAHVGFGGFLFAADGDFGCVEDDHEVACVDMRGEDGFVFTAEEIGGLNGNAAEWLAGGVNHPPLAVDLLGFGRIGFHR